MRTPCFSSCIFLLSAVVLVSPVHGQRCTTKRISVEPGGLQTTGASSFPAVSADGRYVMFESYDGSLIPGDTNAREDVFRKDLQTGVVQIASVASGGAMGTGFPHAPSLTTTSADGNRVCFVSGAHGLVAGDNNGWPDVFVHDFTTGQTTLVSVTPMGTSGNCTSGGSIGLQLSHPVTWQLGAVISADGRFVAFGSCANDLLGGSPGGTLYLRDLTLGTTELVSVGIGGAVADADSILPAISDDGRFVAFASTATNLVAGDTNQRADVFVRDRLLQTTTRVSTSSAGAEGNDDSGVSSPPPGGCGIEGCGPPQYTGLCISGDGRFVAFSSRASNLAFPATSNWNVFVHDMSTGTTSPVSFGDTASYLLDEGTNPVISRDGRFICFTSTKQTRFPDTNFNIPDVFKFDRLTRALTCETVRPDGTLVISGQGSTMSSIDSDGSVVAFGNLSNNVVPGDTNNREDVFVRVCTPSPGSAYCFATAAACPCANAGEPFAGCAHANGGGGSLDAIGTASVAHDSLRLSAASLPATTVALFVQGTAASSAPFGDGIGCTGGSQLRLAARVTASGSVSFGAGVGNDPTISQLGAIPGTGGLRYYQVVYRDASAFCTSSTFNTTNGFAVDWTP